MIAQVEAKVLPVKKKSKLITQPNDFELALLSHYHSTKEIAFSDAIELLQKYEYLTDNDSLDKLFKNIQALITDSNIVPFPGPNPSVQRFTFIDLFAGIGGFRMALQNLGGKCIFTSEWDKYSKQTYFANYGEYPFGDITSDEVKQHIPEKFDILCGGFPCQPFSLAGVSKKNSLGRLHGFQDEKQGNLFFHIEEILRTHRPKAFILENVKNLVSHDKGNTFKIIKEKLINLGYSFDPKVIDGSAFVPQHRERTFMIGFDKTVFGEDIKFDFNSIKYPEKKLVARSILQSEVPEKYTLSDHLWNYLKEYAKKHKEKGNGFGFGLVNLDSITRTISARYHKDGAEILIPQENKNPRRLTPKEAAALQGYPIYPINTRSESKSLKIPVSDTQAYRQFGNSVVMPLIQAIGEQVINLMQQKLNGKSSS